MHLYRSEHGFIYVQSSVKHIKGLQVGYGKIVYKSECLRINYRMWNADRNRKKQDFIRDTRTLSTHRGAACLDSWWFCSLNFKFIKNNLITFHPFYFHTLLGLVIKQILVMAAQDPSLREIYKKTSGVVFYSVPHRGSALAQYSTQAQFLLYPSVEVKELAQGQSICIGFLYLLFLSFVKWKWQVTVVKEKWSKRKEIG